MSDRDLWKFAEQFPEAFAAASNLAEFAAAIGDVTEPGPARLIQYWADKGMHGLYFRTLKAHGGMGRAVALPEARTIGDIFESAALHPYSTGARTVEDGYRETEEGGAFISCNRDAEFAFFGTLGGSYGWSDRFKPGEVRSVRGGSTWLTRGKPSAAVRAYWGEHIGAQREWNLATIETVLWSDGRRLIIGRAHNGFGSRWLALLPASETAMSLLSEHERGEIAAEKALQRAAWEAPAASVEG